MRNLSRFIFVLIGITGCEAKGIDIPEVKILCEETQLFWEVDEQSSFGLSGQEFLDRFPAELQGIALFFDGQESELQIYIETNANALWQIVNEPTEDNDNEDPCFDTLMARVDMILQTSDGLLNESLVLYMEMRDPATSTSPNGEIHFSATLEDFNGTYDYMRDPNFAQLDGVQFFIFGSLLDNQIEATLSGRGTMFMGEDNVWEESYTISTLMASGTD